MALGLFVLIYGYVAVGGTLDNPGRDMTFRQGVHGGPRAPRASYAVVSASV